MTYRWTHLTTWGFKLLEILTAHKIHLTRWQPRRDHDCYARLPIPSSSRGLPCTTVYNLTRALRTWTRPALHCQSFLLRSRTCSLRLVVWPHPGLIFETFLNPNSVSSCDLTLVAGLGICNRPGKIGPRREALALKVTILGLLHHPQAGKFNKNSVFFPVHC